MDVLSDLLRMDTKPIHTAGLELLIGADTEDVPAFPRIRMRERIRVPLWAYEFYRMVQGCLSLYTTGAVTAGQLFYLIYRNAVVIAFDGMLECGNSRKAVHRRKNRMADRTNRQWQLILHRRRRDLRMRHQLTTAMGCKMRQGTGKYRRFCRKKHSRMYPTGICCFHL